ncbi:protein ENHANCED DISEASE RESISTANCE 2-like [Salvia divinorum]|uniref:Protein ENHANCED DISEASE RESISTANCE 2-like n=1 Tax=Salvia divinorum TaxID=28513 RepID=A0ABD1GFA4_SALDI
MAGNEGEMRGWLYLIRYNRFGLQYSRKRYFILEDNCLKRFKSQPTSDDEEPMRSAIIDSCIRVVDNGRESYRRKLFFIFTLYNTSNHRDRLKLGVTSSEEAARWVRALQDAALNPGKDLESSTDERKWQPFTMSVSKRMRHKNSIDWTATSMQVNTKTSDVVAPASWKIFGCQNGLRLFKEAKETDPTGKEWDEHPAIMAVAVIDGTPEAVFRTLMSIGTSRNEWDFSFSRATVVEHLDGHTDIVHLQLNNHWLPWAMKRRDLLLRRYWRREDDGTYVILYHSVFHRKCPPHDGYVRACLKSGGYVISPSTQEKECVIKHMLAIDWKCWKSYIQKGAARTITTRMLEKVAALRELFRTKGGKGSHDYIPGEVSEKEEVKTEASFDRQHSVTDDESSRQPASSSNTTLMALRDSVDEFFDVPEPSDDEGGLETGSWAESPDMCFVEQPQTKISSATTFMKKLHNLAVQKKGYIELPELSTEESSSHYYGSTLPKDPSYTMPCSWAAADPSSFLIRGENYLKDNKKNKAKTTLMQLVAADWLRSEKREDDLSGRPGSIVQKYGAVGGSEFFFVINIQIPGPTMYNLTLYYMLKTPLEETPLLEKFVNGDDTFRNLRFKLIPYISQGSWIVKQSVGKKSCLLGQSLEVNYFRGNNYLELDIDVGSSTVARGVVNLVLGYLNNLVIEMAFLIQGNNAEELPEALLGTCRLNHLDAGKSIATDSIR